MVRDSFAAFILSHGRANNVKTVRLLESANYTGKWYIILDSEDSQIDLYKSNFGEEHIIVFDKDEIKSNFDIMDNFDGNKVITFARNAVNKIAQDLGLEYFWELEDDYTEFNIRMEMSGHLPILQIEDLDSIIEAFLDYLDTPNLTTIAFAQGGEMMGGVDGQIWKKQLKRKAMNTFFFKVSDLPISAGNQFKGRMNDDVNWYIEAGKVGKVILQTASCTLRQEMTQQQKSGIAETYKSFGTYVKSFYSILLRPDCVKISVLGAADNGHKADYRIHHKIDWAHCVPCIISDRYKK